VITLLVDAGNSAIKWSLLDGGKLSKMKNYQYKKSPSIEVYYSVLEEQLKTSKVGEVVMVSVLGADYIEATKKYTQQTNLQFINVESRAKLSGVTNAYAEPHKLGADRLVAMVGAYHLDLSQAAIVIDSGTATTIDAIDSKGQHLGGLILPGLDLCSQSLLERTEQLALFNEGYEAYEENIFSTDTRQAIENGSLYGLVGAISNICKKMEEEIKLRSLQNDRGKTIVRKLVCGGSAKKLLLHLPSEFIYCEDLVIQGLKIISEEGRMMK